MADPENTISTGSNHAPSLWFTGHHQLNTFPGWFGLSSGVTGQELGPLSSSMAWKILPISKNVSELKTQGTFSTRRKSLPRMCLEVSNEGGFQKSPATVLRHPVGAWGDQVCGSVGKTSHSGQGQLPLPSLKCQSSHLRIELVETAYLSMFSFGTRSTPSGGVCSCFYLCLRAHWGRGWAAHLTDSRAALCQSDS